MAGNLADLVRDSARRSPAHAALIEGHKRVTWSQLDALVDDAAAGLRSRGHQPGERIAILMGNRIEFAVAYFAILRAGLVAVPLNAGYTGPEIADLIPQCGAELILAEPTTLRVAFEGGTASGRGVPVMDVTGPDWARLTTHRSATAAKPAQSPVETTGDELAVLLFTSGTSGKPKAAMLHHRTLLADLEALDAIEPRPMTADDIVLMVLPMFHVYALNAALGLAAKVGASCVLVDRFDPVATLETIRREGVTNIPGAPPMYIAWSGQPDLRESLKTVRLMVSGAAALPPAVFEQYRTLGLPVWEGYGMTETAPVITSTLVSGRSKAGSVGTAIPGLELRLLDEDGDEVDDGDPGEIWVRGPSVFAGYWPDGEDGPDDEGWYATGDVAYADEDGDLHLVDRRREMVIVSGFNVYPREIEDVLITHPDVFEAAVIGISHPYTGEAVKAYVVPRRGAQVTADQIVAFCEKRLARFKCPTIVEVVDDLPHSATGKVAKGLLRD